MKQVALLTLGGLLLVVAPIAAGKRADAVVNVTITRSSCAVSPKSLVAGSVVVRVRNRSVRVATFFLAGRRVGVAPSRSGRVALSLRAGRVAYSCMVGTRRVGSGLIRVSERPRPPPQHQVAVRIANGKGEFYNRFTGERFIPRGANYIRIASQQRPSGEIFTYHSTFNTDAYDPARAENVLREMAANGYNVARVFLNGLCAKVCLGDAVTRSLSGRYLQNVVDFLRRAKANGLVVMLTQDFVPLETRYDDLLNAVPRSEVDNTNINYLTEGGVRANAEFWHDLAAEFIRVKAPTDAIFAYEVNNEAALLSDALPFTRSTGKVTTANGRTYDLGVAADRQRMIDENLVSYVDHIRTAVRQVDATALVTIGFFEPQEPNPARIGDVRIVRTQAVIRQSSADFVDLHAYPGGALTLAQYAQNFGIDGSETKPVIMGEFGAFKPAYSSAEVAASTLAAWQRESCAHGVDGWLLWTWDSEEQPELWNALNSGGAIEHALAPMARPDPCQ